MIVVRKVLMGIVWFFVIYFGTCFLLGAAAGAVAGANDPQNAHEAGRLAGGRIVAQYILYILGGSLLAAIVGSATGFLPGTKGKPKEPRSNQLNGSEQRREV